MNGEETEPVAQDGFAGIFSGDLSIGEVLEQLRRRLLDLTARNRLLNFRHSPTKTAQLVDAVPNAVYEKLVDGRTLTFVPVPDPRPSEYEGENRKQKPELREYAKKLGIGTSYELAGRQNNALARGNEGLKLRVLAYPDETERLCRRISKEARSAIEETGTNMLYLVFGFLEFYESDESDRTLLAPLIAVPVGMKRGAIDRDSRLPLYDITYTGDEVAENLSLREKLRAEFAMELPTLKEDTDPEDYFTEVAEAIETRPRWKVRRQITLALLSFAKMLLVNDLDPKNWPQGFHRSKLEEHQLVRIVFGDLTADEDAGIESPDYDIDNRENNNLALIHDADTSQHSALIDALEGKNLVVNGPPGTGKSQTITNLIAEAILRGKRVLFVSEKLAALEVVKNRLEQAKLGQFCLELHSHKTQKKRVLENLAARLNGKYPQPPGLDGNLQLLEQQKKQLQAYADLMNTKLGNELELTVFEILWRAERHRQEAMDAAALLDGMIVADAPHCGPASLGRMTSNVDSLARHFAAIGQYGISHPWFGFFPTRLRPGDDLEIQGALTALAEGSDGVDRALEALMTLISDAGLPREMAAQIALATTLKELPALSESMCPELLPCFFRPDGSGGSESTRRIGNLKSRVEEAKRLVAATSGKLNRDAVIASEVMEKARTWLECLSRHGAELRSLSELMFRKDEIASILTGISKSLAFFSELGELLSCSPEQTDAVLRKTLAVLHVCNEAPKDLLEYRLASFGRPSTKELAARASTEFERLHKLHGELSRLFYLEEPPDSKALASAIQTFRDGDAWYRFFQGHWRRACKFYKGLARNKTKQPTADCLQQLTTLTQFLRDHDYFQVNADYMEAFGRIFKGDRTDFGKIDRLLTWYERAQEIFAGASLAPGEFDITAVEDYRIVQLSEHLALGQVHAKALSDALERLITLSEGSHLAPAIQGAHLPWSRRTESARTLALELGNGAHFFKGLAGEALSPGEITQALFGQLALRSILEAIEGDKEVQELLSTHYAGLDTNFVVLEQTLAWGTTIATTSLPQKMRALLLSGEAKERFAEIQKAGVALGDAWNLVSDVAGQMGRLAEFNWDKWNSVFVDRPGKETTDAIRTRVQLALDNLDGLLSWSQYLNAREEVERIKLGPLIHKLEAGVVQHALLIPGFLYRFYASIAQSLFRSNEILSRFSGMTHTQARETFVRLDREVIRVRGQECAARISANTKVPAGNSAARVDDRTERELLRHLISLQRPRTPIRQMMKRAGRAIQALKPCFMMGPLAVAQYLEPGAVEFDLVIMDEASQLKPEEAIGAIARGTQLVVVGDPNQLPPTSFFDRMMSVEDEDDDSQSNVATSSESILDICLSVFQRRTLKWHYRSKHESLIAFSNRHFYDGQLFVFPSPYPKTKNLGLRYNYVPKGIYQNRQNLPEARRVVDAVIEHMQSRPDESLGVVTLNITQRDLIDELLEQRLRSFEPGEQFRTRWDSEGWPFFVKNLENVQGDERDVIYISTTFGKAPGTDVVRQNFGPINKAHGWRRLNVLFTRAKKSLQVFSSMQPEDIIVDARTPRGMAALRDYLEFASRGILTGTSFSTRPPDSDFEVAVINVLATKGYEVQPQLGVAKFFIDIAVRNPDRRGEFMAAIECDGATYHSGVSVRDRDRIRQEILESLGWKDRIWRIWSTDWFRDPRREIGKLVAFLEKRREASAQEPPPYYDEPEPKPVLETESARANVAKAQPKQPMLIEPEMPLFALAGVGEDEELFVEVGDKVVYLDLDNPGEKNSFWIVAEGHIPTAGLINEAKPLAQAFLGATEGEMVKMEVQNRPTRQFKLLKIERASEATSA